MEFLFQPRLFNKKEIHPITIPKNRVKKVSITFLAFFLIFWVSSISAIDIKEKDIHTTKGVFVGIWTMTNTKKMGSIIDLVEKTELNALVIDVKDAGGNLVFDWVNNLDSLIGELRKRNIYLIGRIAVFKDSRLAVEKSSIALKRKQGGFWTDNLGGKWVDPCAQEARSYVVEIAKKAIKVGFDEINFDYIRFPSEGNLKEIVYPIWNQKISKNSVIRECFEYFNEKLKPLGKPLSIDFFAYSVFCNCDLGVGQKFADTFDYFEYLCPMIYPSHYSKGNFGFSNPAEHPYEVVYKTLSQANKIILESKINTKIRPWLQDFDLGAKYTTKMIRLQKKAVYDVLGERAEWLLWNPTNAYTKEAID